MPMDFTTHESVVRRAEQRGFRSPHKGGWKWTESGISRIMIQPETEAEYRIAFANYMKTIDLIESEEVLNGIGWDKWNSVQKANLLKILGLEPKAIEENGDPPF
jgi:hypothetical protein